ncbi:MAG TPA: hypothetical protein VNA69_10405 [Thermoanaerobaculia bacterium]|nr:hypothetical protein [Thermoanaerobaculia bacterium]
MNAANERALVLRNLLEDVAPPAAKTIDVPHRTYGIVLQIVFFVLTCLGLLALGVFSAGVVTGVIALALAEYLIRARRWWWTGVESALWIGGLFWMLSALPHSGKPEALLLIAAASAVAGARVRNPLFGALALGFTMHYIETRFDAGLLFAVACAAVAVVALRRTWQRPSTEWLWIAIALTLPLAGYAEADPAWRTTTIALYAAFGALALICALTKRHHAFFLAAAIGFTIATIEIGRILRTPLEAKLAAGGAFLLALAFVVSRLLQDRERGFVLKAERLTRADELIEIAGAIAIAHEPQKNVPESRPEGGGGFGGGGATGSFE